MAQISLLIPDMRGGGAERVALTLIEGFLERGHNVDLVLLQARGELLELLPPSVRIVDLKVDRIRKAVLPLVRYLRSNAPAGLIAFMWPMPVLAVVSRFLAASKARIVTSDHGILSQHYRSSLSRRAALWLTTKIFYPFADRRVAASAGIANDLAVISGLSRDRIDVIANPVVMPPVQIDIGSEIEVLWGGDGVRVLTVGSLKPEKNHRLLLSAFVRLARTRDARLMIVGEGPLRKDTERFADELGIAELVTMPGFRPNCWPFYASADLFVLSSCSEGFGNVLVEAMAAGLPIVSTDCGGPREVLEGGKFGRLVPGEDADALAAAMVAALDGSVDRDALKRRAEQFRPAVAIDAYLEAVLGRPGWNGIDR